VLPARHEIRDEERITREIHTHDVFHRILPVIETEILPPKHYVPSQDGKGLVEIPEHMVPGRTSNGSPSRNWEIVQTGMGKGDHGAILHRKTPSNYSRRRFQSLTHSNYRYSSTDIEEDESADGPVIGYTRGNHSRGDSNISTPTRANPRASMHTPKSSITKSILEPVLSSKKEYITNEGHPKTEYVWRHPPVFETASGQTQPIYIGAGLGDLSASEVNSTNSYYSDEEGNSEAEFGAMRTPTKGEEGLLFRDGGYGSHGMLPGLKEKTPLAGMSNEPRFVPEDFEIIKLGKVVGEGERKGKAIDSGEGSGEATKALKRIREKRRSSGATSSASTVKPSGSALDAVEGGMAAMNVRE
jgi:hypothetical protein